MKVILFGSTGMIGQGVLRECVRDPAVEEVLCVGRRASGQAQGKVRELVHADMYDFSAVSDQLAGYDAGFFCLGVSSTGLDEAAYTRVTVDITVAAARVLLERNPKMTFVFVSGSGADSSGKSRMMWARVKGRAENAVLGMGFARAYVFRPAFVQPVGGLRSRTRMYNVFYAILWPLLPLLKLLFARHVSTTERVGQAMLQVARGGAEKPVLENGDINALARRALLKG